MKHFLENTFLLSIILIGGIGVFFSFTNNNDDAQKERIENLVNDFRQNDNYHSTDDEASFLRITGNSEVDEKMHFEIKSYNSNATYTLDLGNGIKKHFKNNKQRYTYKDAGRYNLKLFITYNGNTKLVHKQQMNIAHQVVASNQSEHIN